MKNKVRVIFYIITILLVGIMNVVCNSEGKLFEEKNIIGLNISYLDKEKIDNYELELGEKYPYTHLLEITNNSSEVIEGGYVYFDFVNDSGI